MKQNRVFATLAAVLLLTACGGPSVPTFYTESSLLPNIYPDYTEVTIPVNIAPLTFELDEPADEMIARYAVGNLEVVCADKMQPSLDDWREMTTAAKDAAIKVDVYARHDDQWTHF